MIEAHKPLEELEYDTIKTNKKIEYINLSAGFDIETSSVLVYGQKMAFSYIWMLGIGHNKNVYYGRTLEQLEEFISRISEHYETSESRRLVIYVHNLAYEFQFIRHYFDWLEVFAVGERKPIKATTAEGIEFRDSYILSGFSLANTAKNLTTHKVDKLEGDLEYSLTRHHTTPMTEKELGYCENDIRVITAYITEQMAIYKDVTKIPMTNTGRVRSYVREECYYNNKNHKKSSSGKYMRYRKIMKDLTLDMGTYKRLKNAFMGGFTHASNSHSGKLLEGVDSIDLSSSYPAVMVAEKFPMSRPRKVEVKSLEELKQLAKENCLLFNVKLEGLYNKLGHESYISESKCVRISGPKIDNGRVYSADSLETTITEIDLEIIEAVYGWDSLYVGEVQAFRKAKLPKPIVKSILDLYKDKTELKGVEGKETEYLLSKGMLNSIYGMSVTDILQDLHEYSGHWYVGEKDFEEMIEEYNESRNRFLYYPWGIWVTAYARRNVWSAILSTGGDYIYCDTDSVKMFNYGDHKGYIDAYNNRILHKLMGTVKEYKLDASALIPKNIYGEEKPLGIWEHEGHYSRFKTLGAKRYMLEEDGKISLVVAGLSKQKGMDYISRKCDNNVYNIFKAFDNTLHVPASETGKLTHTYIDDELEAPIEDYLGNVEEVSAKSSIHLSPCEFTLSISTQYQDFLKNLSSGYIYKGVKHV